MFRSIVVPVDLAERQLSQVAIDHAVALARGCDGRVILVNVVPVVPVTMMEAMPATYEVDLSERASEELKAVATRLDLPPGRAKAVTRIGSVPNEVLDVAADEKADLIVVGSHLPGIATYLIGSNSTSIVRHATCSVLVLREAPTDEPPAAV